VSTGGPDEEIWTGCRSKLVGVMSIEGVDGITEWISEEVSGKCEKQNEKNFVDVLVTKFSTKFEIEKKPHRNGV